MIGELKKNDQQSMLQSLDLFGTNVNIRYNQKECFNTKCGGFITCTLASILIVYAVNVGQIFFQHTTAQVIQETKYVENQQKLSLQSDIFSFMISLTDIYYNTFIDERIYNLEVTQVFIKRVYNVTTGLYDQIFLSHPLTMERCTQDHFQVKETANFFLQLPYSDSYCFSKQDQDIALEGEYNSIQYRGIEIELKQCEGDGCAHPDEIKQRLDNCYLQIQFTDRNIISTNFEQPFQPIGKNLFYIGGTQLSKTINVYLLPTKVNTESGMFSYDLQSETTLTFSQERESVINRSTSRIFLVQISLDPNKELNYYRKYISFASALSQIGGIYNILFALGCFICKPYALLKYKRNLINTVFGFQYSDKEENLKINQDQLQENNNNNTNNLEQTPTIKKNDSNENKIDEVIPQEIRRKTQTIIKPKANTSLRNSTQLNDQNQSNTSEQNSFFQFFNKQTKQKEQKQQQDLQQSIQFSEKMNKKELKKTQNQLKSFFKQTFEELKLNTIDYIKFYVNYFSCRRKKSQIIDYSLQKLYNHLDICYILNKLIEFEKFKKLLLDDDQIKLFEYIPKPIIKIDKSSQEIIQISSDENQQAAGILLQDENKTFLQKSEEAQNAYKSIILKDQSKKNPLDEKLINLLHPKLVDLFKDNIFEKVESNTEKIYKFNPRRTVCLQQINQLSPQQNKNSLRDTSNGFIKEMYSPQTLKSNIESPNQKKIDSLFKDVNESDFELKHLDENENHKQSQTYNNDNYNMNFNTIVNKKNINLHYQNNILYNQTNKNQQ